MALEELSNALADSVEHAAQSLVRVEARRRLPATGIVWSADGLIVTAHHVVTRDEDITVGLPNGERVSADLVGRDPHTDLAILRAHAEGLTAATWADLDAARIGHIVLAVGRPGTSPQATLGIISALGDSWRAPSGGSIERYLQTDVVMYPGFSGGPLIDVNGHALGMNTSSLVRGVSVALPGNTISRVADTLVQHGRMRQGYLGVGVQPVRLPEELQQELDQETGLLIMNVAKGSPAAHAELLMGDTIVTFDGMAVRQMDDLLSALSGDKIGTEVPVTIIRGGEIREAAVTIGDKE
ncbi:MAG: PDZ domain-containing protein [Chloroflexi bacterium]|nr:PDZ domain-containing protein [Chloroflexota bacterium]